MLLAKYVGTGNFSDRRWDAHIEWSCKAFWSDASAQCPSILLVTLKPQYSGVLVRDARLEHFEGLFGSRPSYTMSVHKKSKKFARSYKTSLTLRFEGFQGAEIVLSGDWCKNDIAGQTNRGLTLQGRLEELGDGTLPVDTTPLAARCNVQSIAISLEPLLKRLADTETLSKSETRDLHDLISSYSKRVCGTQQCHPVNCALRQQADWLTYLGYQDLRDALDYAKSGLDANPPKLKRRPGVEILKLTALKQPGHFAP